VVALAPTARSGGLTARGHASELTAGRWATGEREVVIDKGVAADEGYAVGDTIGVAARGPIEQFEIVGIARYGDVDSIGSATFAIFDVPTAQRLFDKEGELDGIQVAAAEGVSGVELIADIEKILPPGTKVPSGAQGSGDAKADIEGFKSFIPYFLLAFVNIGLVGPRNALVGRAVARRALSREPILTNRDAIQDTTKRQKAVVISDWYVRRLTIHRYGSYLMLPLFAAEYLLGRELLAQKEGVWDGTRRGGWCGDATCRTARPTA